MEKIIYAVKIIIWLFVLVWLVASSLTESSKVKVKNRDDGIILENGTKAIVENDVKIGDVVHIYNNAFFNFLPSDKQNPYENTDRFLGYDGMRIFILLARLILQFVFIIFGAIHIYNSG